MFGRLIVLALIATPASALAQECPADPSLTRAAAELAIRARALEPSSALTAAREAGSDAPRVDAIVVREDDRQSRAGAIARFAARRPEPIVCGEASAEGRRVILLAPAAGHLETRGRAVRASLADGWSDGRLFIRASDGRILSRAIADGRPCRSRRSSTPRWSSSSSRATVAARVPSRSEGSAAPSRPCGPPGLPSSGSRSSAQRVTSAPCAPTDSSAASPSATPRPPARPVTRSAISKATTTPSAASPARVSAPATSERPSPGAGRGARVRAPEREPLPLRDPGGRQDDRHRRRGRHPREPHVRRRRGRRLASRRPLEPLIGPCAEDDKRSVACQFNLCEYIL